MIKLPSNYPKILVGYVTPRTFGQFCMPVPAQNSCLREYAIRNEFVYALPQCEHIFNNSYVQLFGTLNSLEVGGNIVMYSMLMLPEQSSALQKIADILNIKNINIHFVLENKIINKEFDFCDFKLNKYIAKVAKLNRNIRL